MQTVISKSRQTWTSSASFVYLSLQGSFLKGTNTDLFTKYLLKWAVIKLYLSAMKGLSTFKPTLKIHYLISCLKNTQTPKKAFTILSKGMTKLKTILGDR